MQCHGNLNSSKLSQLPRQALSLEDIAVDTFVHSSCETVVMTLFQGFLTVPSWHTFTSLARGWALATNRHTITTYWWLTGATTVTHFSRFYVFLGGLPSHHRWHLWGAVIRLAARFVPAGAVIRVSFDDTTKKKAGHQVEGLARYRKGAGSARQAYRTLRGVHFVLGMMHTDYPAKSDGRGTDGVGCCPHGKSFSKPWRLSPPWDTRPPFYTDFSCSVQCLSSSRVEHRYHSAKMRLCHNRDGKEAMLSVKGTFQNGVARPAESILGEGDLPPQATANETVWDALQQLVEHCTVETGISDLAHQHDHYLYGKPKQE
jgi:hypothetical protein